MDGKRRQAVRAGGKPDRAAEGRLGLDAPAGAVAVGRIAGVYGVKGWVKVYSYTRPRDQILRYNPWLVYRHGTWAPLRILDGRIQGRGLIARIEGCTDRDQAHALIGAEIAVDLAQLPVPGAGEYYWAQLEGLRVVNLQGVELGTVSHLLETGANDVLVVKGEREHLIPVVGEVIREVDTQAGLIRVDWDPDF